MGFASTRNGASPRERAASDRTRILLKVNNAIVSHLDLAQVLNAVSACVRREAKVLCRLERAVPLPSKMLTLFEPEFTAARPSFPSPLKSASAAPAGCPDLVAHSGLEVQRPTCRSLGGKQRCQNCTRFLLLRHGGGLFMLSTCNHSYENGGSRSRTTNTSFGV
jgi:hypothetical protein